MKEWCLTQVHVVLHTLYWVHIVYPKTLEEYTLRLGHYSEKSTSRMSCRDCAGPSPCSMFTRVIHEHQLAAHMSASVQDPFVALSAEQLQQVLPAPQLSAFS